MPKNCHPLCVDKRDFMEVNPARKLADFYRDYDPYVGIGTAFVLCTFFFVVTISGCVKYGIRRWKMYKFYKKIREEEQAQAAKTVSQFSAEFV